MESVFIRIITAGGTIDKIYFDAKSEYQVGEPNIAAVLEEMQAAFRYSVESVLRKDSLDITAADRQLICHTVASGPADRVIITHGTDTMVETAQALAATEGVTGKTVVLTGALAPATFRNSDAVFNIGTAVAAAQTLPAGVYIAMNGRIYTHDNVRKNVAAGRFESLH